MATRDVDTAFEILLEEVEAAISAFSGEAKQFIDTGEYEKGSHILEKVKSLNKLRKKIQALQKEWSMLLNRKLRPSSKRRRKDKARLPRGLRTPESAFRRPILEALVELGGQAPTPTRLRAITVGWQDSSLADYGPMVSRCPCKRGTPASWHAAGHMGHLRSRARMATTAQARK